MSEQPTTQLTLNDKIGRYLNDFHWINPLNIQMDEISTYFTFFLLFVIIPIPAVAIISAIAGNYIDQKVCIIDINENENLIHNEYTLIGKAEIEITNAKIVRTQTQMSSKYLLINQTSQTLVIEKVGYFKYKFLYGTYAAKNPTILIEPYSFLNLDKPISWFFNGYPMTISERPSPSAIEVKYYLRKR